MPRTILLPVDVSSPPTWEHALPQALAMADGGALHVITVVPNFGTSLVGSYFSEGFAERALHDVGQALADWVNIHVPEAQEVHPHVTIGRIYDEIIRAADRLKADTIVIGSPPADLPDYLLGPNAARVVRHARQSVYVVRG